jgi:hypothetical protein
MMDSVSDDLMIGGKLIAEFLFNKADRAAVRKVYHLADADPKLGIFDMGGQKAARKSRLTAEIERRERGEP